MPLKRTSMAARVKEVEKILFNVEIALDYLTPKNRFCPLCVGVKMHEDDKFPYRHENDCLRVDILKWRKKEFSEV